MDKNQFAADVAATSGLTKAQAKAAIDAVGDHINLAVRGGDEIVLPGVGKFYRKQRAARTGRNVRTGETMQIAPHGAVGFKVAKVLKDAIA